LAKINPNLSRGSGPPEIGDPEKLLQQVLERDRMALARAITLIESERESDRDKAAWLIEQLSRKHSQGLRIGISGSPGTGKSTLIEALGMHLIRAGLMPAILAIDPSSRASGGSILGDKTRMERLSVSDKAFIRPSPAGRTLGGVAAKTRESIFLMESAGYDPVIVETVGVGQSETAVSAMTDLFVLVISPGGGDEIQGIKRGIMEIADIIVVNKMDGNLRDSAFQTIRQYENAVHLMQDKAHGWPTRVLGVSALEEVGIDTLWEIISDFSENAVKKGFLTQNRYAQDIKWFEDYVYQGINDQLLSKTDFNDRFEETKIRIQKGELSPYPAAREFISIFSQAFRK